MKDYSTFPIMDEKEAAEFLKVPHYTLIRLRKSGKGPPHIKVGIKVRYIKDRLIEWLKEEER